MALQAGRVGVNPDEVDIFGRIKRLENIIENIPLVDKKWYKLVVTSDGTDYSGYVEGHPEITLEFHTSVVLLPYRYKPIAFMAGVDSVITGGSQTSNTTIGIQYAYSSSATSKTGFRIPTKATVFNLCFWFCV